ncbi:hypothetical protein [Kribbella speibonae]|uniref:hypothetical protein n=1 Tax=Kribbella speibonae TaxID=1572660 RepID=UPI00192DF683|nr:hypothetical protein [Kribbella speibonae]
MGPDRRAGLPALLGPPGRHRDLALALVVSRVVHPVSKLATASWCDDTSLGSDLGVAGASTDEVYAAMDRPVGRQDSVEAKLARRHLAPDVNPPPDGVVRPVLVVDGGQPLPARGAGLFRDGKKNRAQIEYCLLTDPAGRPVAIKVF